MTDASRPASGPSVRRSRWIIWWLVGTVAVTVLAFVLGGLVRSPWEEAATNAARVPTVTATAQVREFTADDVVVAGTISAGTLTTIRGSAAGDGQAVVTATPLPAGSEVTAGSVIVEISGRPVIALPLPFILYRDLVPGDSGTDVRALQQTLADIGLYTGQVDGSYGGGTAAAVRALYAGTPATAPVPASELIDAVEVARETVDSARGAVASSERERDRARRAQANVAADSQSTGDDVANAQAALEEAESDLKQARTAVSTAQTALAAAETAADTPLPRAETTPVASGTATLVRVAAIGTVLGGGESAGAQGGGAEGAAQVLSGAPSATVRVNVSDAERLAVGARVTVTSVQDSTRTAAGTVAAVGEFATASTLGDFPGYDVTIGFPEIEELVLDDGESISATPTDGAPSQEGVAVPLVALRSDDGQSYVLVAGPGDPVRVAVEVVTTGGGYALVRGDGFSAGVVVVIDDAS